MLIYLDTNIWIYAYESHPELGGLAQQLFHDLQTGRHQLASSWFVLGELLVGPAKRSQPDVLLSYERLFRSAHEVQVLTYTLSAARIYAGLRAFDRLKSLDALHLATAAAAHVDLFVTQDAKLLSQQVAGIGAIVDLAAVVLSSKS